MGQLVIDHSSWCYILTTVSSKSNPRLNVSCLNIASAKSLSSVPLKYNLIDLMSLCCHHWALQLIKTHWVTVAVWVSRWVWPSWQLSSPWRTLDTCIHELTTSYNTDCAPQCRCTTFHPHAAVALIRADNAALKPMYASERYGLFMHKDYMQNVNSLPGFEWNYYPCLFTETTTKESLLDSFNPVVYHPKHSAFYAVYM